MPSTLPALIDKQDGFELVRDQIALLLAENQAAQVALATTAGKPDPNEWKLRVYIERSNPWEMFLGGSTVTDRSPVVNVRYDSGTFDGSKGDVVQLQAHAGIFHIDIIGYGVTKDDGAGGQIPGDETATLVAQRGLRLVRNILMSSQNQHLQLRGTVWKRWPQTINMYQPQQPTDEAQAIVGLTFTLWVEVSELSPQATGEAAEEISVDIKRDSDGMVIAQAEYDFTP